MTPLKIGKAAFCILFFASSSALFAQDQEVKIAVTALPNPVPENESVQLQISVDSPIALTVAQPSFEAPEFTVMGAPSHSYFPTSGADGPNTRKKVTFTFVLMPKQAGDFVIRNIRLRVGQEFRMAPDVRLKVTGNDDSPNPAAPGFQGRQEDTASVTRPASGNHPQRFNSDFTVHLVLSKTKAFVGEPVVAEYYVYDFGHVRQMDVLKWPTFDGFWKEDLHLSMQPAFEEIFVQNQEMRRAFIARYALYGIKPGKLQVDRLGIRGKYISGDAANPGILFAFDLRTGQHFSQNETLEILPLPETGRPENYGGAVGKFSLKLEANKTSLHANTPLTFTLTLTGSGNFQAIDSIRLPLPQDFELYESTAQGRITAPVGSRQELESRKTFQVIAIPRKAGRFEVPAVSWSFFNPEKAAYEALSTEPMTIEVLEDSGKKDNAVNSYLKAEEGNNPGSSAENQLRPLATVTMGAPAKFDFLPMALWAAVALNLLLLFAKIRAKWRSLFTLVKRVDRFSTARITLLQAKGIKDSEWQGGLEEVLMMTMQILLDTNPRGLTKYDLEELWKAKNLPAPLFLRMNALLEEIDRHRFSSQKLTGSGTKDVRSRLTRETESLLTEASRTKKK